MMDQADSCLFERLDGCAFGADDSDNTLVDPARRRS